MLKNSIADSKFKLLENSIAARRPGLVEGLTILPAMTVSEFADKYRILNQKSSPEPGPWSTDRFPPMRDIMDDLSAQSDVEIVALMKPTQVGGTEILNNWLASIICRTPGPAMMVQPTVDLARRWSLQRFAPMLEDMPVLQERIKPSRSRDSGNTTLSKDFDGGVLVATGANSAAGLRSMPVKYLALDEVDAYPHDVDDEGDPVDLAMERTNNFARRKIFALSTPTTADLSRIEHLYNAGDQRQCFVPCPHCEEMQTMEFSNLKWQKDSAGEHLPATVELACRHCGALIAEHHKPWMLARYEWRVTGRPNERHHSYHINRLYAPLGWGSWSVLVEKFLKSRKDPVKLKTFTNTTEARPFAGKMKKIDQHALKARAEDYPVGILPMGALVPLAGVDVQDDRLEVVLWAEGQRGHFWAIDYHVIYGDPAQVSTWSELDDYLFTPVPHAAGCELRIAATAVDSGGHYTQEVYDYCRVRKSREVFATKGYSQSGRPIIGKPSQVDVTIRGRTEKNGGEVWMIGTDTAKTRIYNRLAMDRAGDDNFMHFSKHLPDAFFNQITAEKQDTIYRKGFPHQVWVLPSGARNEVLDCTVGAFAASRKIQLHKWRPSKWRRLEESIQPIVADLFSAQASDDEVAQLEAAGPVRQAAKKKSKNRPRRRASGFIAGALNQ